MLQSLMIELKPVLIWYSACLLLGWGMFPLSFFVFRHFPDCGLALSKILGLFLLSYCIWLSTSLGITQYNRQSIIVVGGFLFLINAILLITQWHALWRHIKQQLTIFLFTEIVFLVFFLAALVIRMYSPDITGAEKEADFTFLNALLHSDSFPPKDTWFAGATINYYYFGYLLWSTMIHLTGIIAPIGFNLAVITIVALSAAGVFGLVYALTQKKTYSLLASLFLVALGNLDGLVQIVQRRGNLLPFDWWRSSRVIPDTINEFPFFSFLLGDLHAHFMSIPGGILFLGLLGQLLFTVAPESRALSSTAESRRDQISLIILLVAITLVLGGTSVINGWDYPTYLLITIGCVGFIAFRKHKHNPNVSLSRQIFIGGGIMALVIFLSRLFFWPFHQHFTPPAQLSHLRVVASVQRTELKYFLIIYGLFLWGILLFMIAHFQAQQRQWKHLDRVVKLVVWNVAILATVCAYLALNTWVIPISGALTGIFLYLLYQQIFGTAHSSFSNSTPLPYLLLFMAFAIITGCELVYIKDFYGHPLERQNTIFKFYYQAWIFLSIGTPYLLARVTDYEWVRQNRWFRLTGKIGLLLLCAACALYPVFATYERAAHFRGGKQGGLFYLPTLNGISYIAYLHPQEYEALIWIQNNLPEQVVILEATGKPYSFFGRVATTTGRSTVLGWGNHEALWRDQSWQSIMQRTDDIKQMYESIDKSQVLNLFRMYNVEYVYVGKLEKEAYQAQGLNAFADAFPVVHQNAFVTIYRVPWATTT